MLEIDSMVEEFDVVLNQFEEAKRKNELHEASDIKAYMCGLTRAMTIVMEANETKYTQEDRSLVDIRITKLNEIFNVK